MDDMNDMHEEYTPEDVAAILGEDDGSKGLNFYARSFPSFEAEFDQAAAVQGLDAEIALLRFEINAFIKKDPYNIRPIQLAVLALDKLVRTRYQFRKDDGAGVLERVSRVLNSIDYISGFKKPYPRKQAVEQSFDLPGDD